jgi:hypothetical protein
LEFRVIWEIDIDAHSPREAAEAARAEQRRDTPATVFYLWEHAGKKMHRIDVAECPDRLDGDELKAIRAHLRLLQCVPDVAANVQHIASAMLIFLDREKMMSSRMSSSCGERF